MSEAEPEGRQGVHPTPWQCTLSHTCHAKFVHCPTPATQKRRSPRDARACIRPLGSAHCPTPATQKRRSPRDARASIRPLGSAHCPTPAAQKRWSPMDARAYPSCFRNECPFPKSSSQLTSNSSLEYCAGQIITSFTSSFEGLVSLIHWVKSSNSGGSSGF